MTTVVPRLEAVFRKDRDEIVEKKKREELADHNQSSNINQSEEERIAAVNKKYYFPSASSKINQPYVDIVV